MHLPIVVFVTSRTQLMGSLICVVSDVPAYCCVRDEQNTINGLSHLCTV